MIALPWRQMGCPDLRAGSLRLVAITSQMLLADRDREHARLGKLLRACITSEWPPAEWKPHVYDFILKQYQDEPQTEGWHRYVVLCDGLAMSRVLSGSRTLVGALGAHPKPGGEVEIGYSTLPAFQRRGFATAAAKVFAEWLLKQESVRSVCACTYPQLPESIKIMERCGMTYAGVGDESGTVKYRRER